jgi:hypothetical protein
MEPIRQFPPELISDALESWSFLDVGNKEPLFASPFGDLFFKAGDGFWFLDAIGGNLSRRWSTEQELSASLNSGEGQDEYLMLGLAAQAEEGGLHPSSTEVYGFRVPPVLGGAVDVGNVEVADFVVAINLMGQIHAQIRDLPPGTPVNGIALT